MVVRVRRVTQDTVDYQDDVVLKANRDTKEARYVTMAARHQFYIIFFCC
jgi:hypothetical protein